MSKGIDIETDRSAGAFLFFLDKIYHAKSVERLKKQEIYVILLVENVT